MHIIFKFSFTMIVVIKAMIEWTFIAQSWGSCLKVEELFVRLCPLNFLVKLSPIINLFHETIFFFSSPLCRRIIYIAYYYTITILLLYYFRSALSRISPPLFSWRVLYSCIVSFHEIVSCNFQEISIVVFILRCDKDIEYFYSF